MDETSENDYIEKLHGMQEKDRKMFEAIQKRMQESPEFRATMEEIYGNWIRELRGSKRTLLRTIPWADVTLGELGVVLPGIEIEVDADNEVVRVYKLI